MDSVSYALSAKPPNMFGSSSLSSSTTETNLLGIRTTNEKIVKLASSNVPKVLDLCLLVDCTSSMSEWISRTKETISEIIDSAKTANPDQSVRVAFVGYRDIQDI